MRIVIKGGVWKNTEDEILKAAISKYGKNQWARISSLLVRKTPKQCKARWYEWLDPSIRKTEWSKEEDEKLLHLAKLMPTQWRTIAPIIGRTATQCLERYQKLLDDAEQRENEELGLTGVTDDAGPSADDVRRLRPGELDPDPETKAARPDPIDMDEDEKEMLSEARARLANTQGKKAKRKARERQLEEARRLAMLQKRRELKAAGIMGRHKNKIKGMDYNADIPFEKRAAPGFYDTTEEKSRKHDAPIGQSLRQLEGPKRKHMDEDEERKKRQKKSEQKGKDAAAMANFLPEKDQQIQRMKEAEQIGNRTRLNLPAPQVGEPELEEIVKIGNSGAAARSLVDDSENDASKGLMGEYSALAHAKNARTPRTAPQADTVMLEARNLRNMTMQQTPLLGDDNTPMHQIPGRTGTGFEGATPRSSVAATPNPLATPSRRAAFDGSATPRTDAGSITDGTPLRTPMRDSLAINAGEMGDNQARSLRALQAKLGSLPAPKNDYELLDPEEDQIRAEEESKQREEDAAERDARNAAYRAEEERKDLARRSQVIKRNLPRPVSFDAASVIASLDVSPAEEMEKEVAKEMIRLLEHDSILYPVPGGSKVGGGRSSLQQIPDDDVSAARALVHTELATSLGFPGASEDVIKRTVSSSVDQDAFDAVWKPLHEDLSFDAKTNSYVLKSSLSPEEQNAGLGALISTMRSGMMSEVGKTMKAEKKLGVVLGGYQARNKQLGNKLIDLAEELSRAKYEMESFERLADMEEGAIPRRIESLRTEVQTLERKEREGQDKYRELAAAQDELSLSINEMEDELAMREAEAINEAAMAAEA